MTLEKLLNQYVKKHQNKKWGGRQLAEVGCEDVHLIPSNVVKH
jgi:hypothetical protein